MIKSDAAVPGVVASRSYLIFASLCIQHCLVLDVTDHPCHGCSSILPVAVPFTASHI